MVTRRRRILAACAVLTVLCSACVPDGLAFRVDDRVSITTPDDRQKVRLPVEVRWTVEDFDVVEPGTPAASGAGYFAVFVDRTPLPPGADLTWVARDDDTCLVADGCPDAAYLAARDVYVTTDTHVVIDDLRDRDDGRRDRHTATIVLVDGAGRRIGESAFDVDFEVERESE